MTSAEREELRAPPAPEYMLRAGSHADGQINWLHEVASIHGDIMKLREFAMRPPREGSAEEGWQIKNPQLFDNQIKRRLDMVQRALAIQQEIYDLNHMREMWDLIIGEIAAADPVVARRIMDRLAELNAKVGLTVHAGLE